MSSVVKSLIIGMFGVVLIYIGAFTFIGDGYSSYGIDNNSSVVLNRTQGYLNSLSDNSYDYQTLVTESGAININVLTLLGLVFNNLGKFVISLFTVGGLVISIFTGLQSSSALFLIPDSIFTIIGGIITTIIAFAGIALLIGRSNEEM